MKNVIWLIVGMFGIQSMFAQVTPPAPPEAPEPPVAPAPIEPSVHVNGETVTITNAKGDVFVIDEYGIRKNGVLIVGDTWDARADAEDLREDIEQLREESGSIDPDSEEYADLMESIADLEAELNALAFIAPDTLPSDSATVTVGKWRLVVKENGEDDDDVDVSIARVPKVEEIDDHYVDVFDTKWFLFDMGYNTFLNADHKVQVDPPYQDLEDLHGWGSFDVNLHIFRSRVNMAKGYINFNYGLSMEWHHFRFDRDFTILKNQDTLTLNTETIDYDKNKFNTTHLSVPVLLGFETKPWDTDNSFRMQFGYDPGLMLRGKTKHKVDGKKDVDKDDFNLAQFRQEVDFIIGYGDFNLYASYDLNSMFADGEGPELHPFSVGLVIRRGF
ncbi:MAG: outer membrane beta-barrel protein [Chitinophagales bacterium]